MSDSQFLQHSFAGGLRSPHYVNGRLLAAEDLTEDRAAALTRLSWIGEAAGYGVVHGMLVRRAVGSLTGLVVTPGLGLSRSGHPVHLSSEITLPLVLTGPSPAPLDDAGRFKDCVFSTPGGATGVPGGAYLLTAAPASRLEGSAPLKAPPGSTIPPGCASRWEVEGLQFKAIRLAGFDAGGSGVTDRNRRNLLAHWCFGSAALRLLARDPFTFDEDYGGLDEISPDDLTPCDLPLAVFHWTGTELTFADPWAARRRPVRPGALDRWQGLLSDRRVADGQARFLQFQDQMDALVAGGGAASAVAAEHFRFLPPAGFLPIAPRALIDRLRAIAGRQPPSAPPELERPAGTTVPVRETAEPSLLEKQLAGRARARLMNEEVTVGAFTRHIRDDVTEMAVTIGRLQEEVEHLKSAAGESGEGEATPPSKGRLKRRARRTAFLRGQASFVRSTLEAIADQARGVDLETFFGAPPGRIGLVDRESVDFTIHRSWHDEAIDLTLSQQERPRIDLFLVEENLQGGGQPYVLFAKSIRPITWLIRGRYRRG